MKHFFFIILSISFLMTETYSWEDGGTILGSYGNILESATANVGETNGITPYDGDFMLTVSESPIDGTPIAYIAWVTDLSEGDEIQACFYGYDNTPNTSPSMRIWGAWSANDDITSYAGAPDSSTEQNNDYTAGTGWDQICHTFSTNMSNWESGEALVIQSRLYSSSSGPDPSQYFIDLVEVTTNSSTATIHFPGAQDPVTGPIANAGEDQSVNAGDTVTLDGSNSYHTEDSDIVEYFWEQVSGPAVILSDEESMITTFVAPSETSSLAFDLSIYDADGNESTDTVVINVVASAGNLTISQIQGETDASPYVDQFVSTVGLVTATNDNGFYLQDCEGPWCGIWVLDFGESNASQGDEIEVTGQVEEYFNLTEIKIMSSIGGSSNILSSNNTLYNPIVISQVSEDYESVLVKAAGTCTELPNEYGEWSLSGITIDDYLYDGFSPSLGQDYTITGPLNYAYSLFRINPRSASDIEDGILSLSSDINHFSLIETYPNPFNPNLSIEFQISKIGLTNVSVYDILGNKIETLLNDIVEANQLQHLTWNASNYSSGEYIIRLQLGDEFITQKVTLLK